MPYNLQHFNPFYIHKKNWKRASSKWGKHTRSGEHKLFTTFGNQTLTTTNLFRSGTLYSFMACFAMNNS